MRFGPIHTFTFCTAADAGTHFVTDCNSRAAFIHTGKSAGTRFARVITKKPALWRSPKKSA